MDTLSARQKELLSLDRWAWLKECIATWYADPLVESDGLSTETIDQAEARLEVRIPGVLREWYELVGARLDFIQDQPLLPHQLQVTNGHLEFWWENQGCWRLGAALNQGDDPPVHVLEVEDEASGIFTLSTWLQAMTLSETLVGVWADTVLTVNIDNHERRSFLGTVKKDVRGGYIDEVSEETSNWITHSFPRLSTPEVPLFEFRTCGDESTILRLTGDDISIEWMTATPAALKEAIAALHLLDGDYTLVLQRRSTTIHRQSALVTKKKPDDDALYRSVLTPDEQMVTMTLDPDPKPFIAEFTTPQPEDLATRLWEVSPSEYREHMEFYASPRRLSFFQRIFPQS
ncbi:MAG: hypothetical protein Q4C87_10915 [Actinomycetaceae bacterium]|nr:hypothetical protein [Actinomycetaceae bacterium]